MFLVADSQLYKSLCPTVRPSVRPSVGPSVREHESKSAKTSILDAFCACEWGTWGVDGGLMPLPTRPQRYCDPASLVNRLFVISVWSRKTLNERDMLMFYFLRSN